MNSNNTISEAELAREVSIKRAKQGSIGGLIFAIGAALGLIFAFAGYNPGNGSEIVREEHIGFVIGIAIQLILITFLSWRVRTGKGFISAIILLILFVIEIAGKFVGGTVEGHFVLLYLLVGYYLIQGIRGTQWLRSNSG